MSEAEVARDLHAVLAQVLHGVIAELKAEATTPPR
jgi:hypothetical protein